MSTLSGPPPTRPPFPAKRAAAQIAGIALALIAALEYFGEPKHLGAKAAVFGVVVAASALLALSPFLYRFAVYVIKSVRAAGTIEARLGDERVNTWRAVEANVMLAGVDLTMLRLKQEGAKVLILVNVGALQGVRTGMQFEVVAIPDMETYGVMTVIELLEESAWCELGPREGRPDFVRQMRNRLKTGEVTPPAGFETRCFMAETYRHVLQSVLQRPAAGGSQATVAYDEGAEE